MILADTSVVIDYVRAKDARLRALLPTLPVAICGITRAEVLHGVRDATNRRNLVTVLNTFQQIAISDALWDTVGDQLASLRTGGITVPFQDVVIAAVAIANNFDLTRDHQFSLIQAALPALNLFQEPP